MISLESVKRLMEHPSTPQHEKEAAKRAYERLLKNPKIKAEEEDEYKWMKVRYDEIMSMSKIKTLKIGVGFTMETFENFEINLDKNGKV